MDRYLSVRPGLLAYLGFVTCTAACARLMAIVTASTDRNERTSALKDNIEDLGGVVLKVLGAVL